MKKNQSKYGNEHLEKLAEEMLKEKKAPLDDLKKEVWLLGVDEAGRGPVLGPMVYGACYWPKSYDEIIKKSVFDDSKKLTEAQRDSLFVLINKLNGEMLRYECIPLSAEFLSINQLSHTPNNLNAMSHQTALTLIKNAISHGYNIKECFIDTVGPKQDYRKYLKDNLKVDGNDVIEITVEEKADAKFQTVSAASICAKVTRDFQISEIQKSIPKKKLGSGYPADPKTQSFINEDIIPVFGYPNIVRFSWQTVPTAMAKQGLEIEYFEENNSKPQEDLKQLIFKTKKISVLKFRMQYAQQVFF